jgi:GAF domain-containing protein
MHFVADRLRPALLLAAAALGLGAMAYNAFSNMRQQGRARLETSSVSAQVIESAVLDSFRHIATDPALAETVAREAGDRLACRRREVELLSENLRRSLGRLNRNLAREAADSSLDPGARFEQMAPLRSEIGMIERRLAKLDAELTETDRARFNGDGFRRTLNEFGSAWSALNTREQEQMVHILVAKSANDKRFGRDNARKQPASEHPVNLRASLEKQ